MRNKEVPWFRHDFNARRDPKLVALRMEAGMAGIGRYWVLVELLREQSAYRLQMTKWTYAELAKEWDCTPVEAQKILDLMIKIKLFRLTNGCIWSASLTHRMKAFEAKVRASRQAAKNRWHKEKERERERCERTCQRTASALPTQCGHNARDGSRGDRNRLDRTREEGIQPNSLPHPSPVDNLVDKMLKINPALQIYQKQLPLLLDACARHGTERMLAAYAEYQQARPGKAMRFFLEDYGEYLPVESPPPPEPQEKQGPRCPGCGGPLEKDEELEELYGCERCRTWYRPNSDGMLKPFEPEE